MKAGFLSYMGGKITEYIKSERAVHELNQKIRAIRFVKKLRSYTKKRGMDISQFL